MAWLVFACAAAPGATPDRAPWWDDAYHYRMAVTVNSLFWERKDVLVRAKVDFLEQLVKIKVLDRLALNSIRVVEAGEQEKGRLLPSQFNTTDHASGDVCWVLKGKTPPLTERRYFIYFDTLEHGLKPKPAFGKVPGADRPAAGNRVRNPGFEEPDPADARRAVHWDFGEIPLEGACRTDEDAHSGRYCLKLDTHRGGSRTVSISQRVPAQEGKKYLVRGWIKYKAHQSGTAGVWAWYDFAKPQHAYGNYKTSASMRGVKEWMPVSASWINVYNQRLKQNLKIPATLPGTKSARVSPSAYYGQMTVYLDDVAFIELDRDALAPVEVTVGEVEKKAR